MGSGPLRRLFGRFWMPWFPPQHQHMMPLENLRHALTERGFTVVALERGASHQSNDFVLATYLRLSTLVPQAGTAWTPVPSRARRRWASAVGAPVWFTGIPLLIGAVGLDALASLVAWRVDRGNAYRLLARKDDHHG